MYVYGKRVMANPLLSFQEHWSHTHLPLLGPILPKVSAWRTWLNIVVVCCVSEEGRGGWVAGVRTTPSRLQVSTMDGCIQSG